MAFSEKEYLLAEQPVRRQRTQQARYTLAMPCTGIIREA